MRRVNYPWCVAVLVVVTILYTIIFATKVHAQTIDTTTEEQRDTTIVSTTMYNDCYDTTMFEGNARIEQMFVEEVNYENENSNSVLLIDTSENTWNVIDIDLFQGEEVLVLLVDNNTDEIEDDIIVHCWVGIE